MTKWYQKELQESPVYVNGFPLKFDILETSDPSLISELDKCVHRQAGGVIAITQEQYQEELKKKANGTSSSSSLKPKGNRREITAFQSAGPVRAAEHVANPAVKDGVFARPQRSEWQQAPQPSHPMPDPIEVPNHSEFNIKPPPTIKLKDM